MRESPKGLLGAVKIKVMTNLANKILANDNYDEVMLACKLAKLQFKLNLLKIKNKGYENKV